MNTIIESNFSVWQSARRAIELFHVATGQVTPERRLVGLDANGEIAVGDESDESIVVPVVRLHVLGAIVAHEQINDSMVALCELADLFATVSSDHLSDAVTNRLELTGKRLQASVRFAPAKPRDRIERHIAEGCLHCSGVGRVSHKVSTGWSPIEAWESRWRIAGFPVEEAARWTELIRCNPEAAIELRAAGITPDNVLHYYEQRYSGAPEVEAADLVDPILIWLNCGFSWQEIEEIAPEICCPIEVLIARELRLRAVSKEEADRQIVVDGKEKLLWDFLYEPYLHDDHELSLDEKLALLEERSIVSRWAA